MRQVTGEFLDMVAIRRRAGRRLRGPLLTGGLAFFSALVTPWAADSKPVRVGALVAFQGKVTVDEKAVDRPGPLAEGARIRTGKDSSCSILLSKDAVLHLGHSSDISLTRVEAEKRKMAIQLDQGRMRALVKSGNLQEREFTVRSRAATLGVRGTQFVVDVPPGELARARVTTLEGKVGVISTQPVAGPGANAAPAAEVLVSAGQQWVRQADGARSGGGSQLPGEAATREQLKPVPQAEITRYTVAAVEPPRAVLVPQEFVAGLEQGGLLPQGPGPDAPPPPRGGWDPGAAEIKPAGPGPQSGPGGVISFGGWPGSGGGIVTVDPVADSPVNSGSGHLQVSVGGDKQSTP